MEEPKQYMASKGRPRHSTGISTSARHCIVMLSASETSLAIAVFVESKMTEILRFAQNDNVPPVFL